MTTGELAKRMSTTVRTLQYYDRLGLLKPSGRQPNGRREYTDQDMIRLHQIQSLKYLGFSLKDIQQHLVALDTPEQVLEALKEQKAMVDRQIENLQEASYAIDTLCQEITNMNQVDFSRYADIITLLKRKNEYYWVLKYFNEPSVRRIEQFTEKTADDIIHRWMSLCDQIIAAQKNGVLPDSPEGERIARDWWEMVMKFTGGDPAVLADVLAMGDKMHDWRDSVWKQKQEQVNDFLTEALEHYLPNQGIALPEGETDNGANR